MKPRKLASTLTLFAVCLALPALCRNSHEQGWILNQKNSAGSVIQLLVNSQGVRAVDKTMGISSLVKAPDWKQTVITDNEKTYYQAAADQPKAASSKNSAVSSIERTHRFRNIAPKKGETTTIAGLSATKYYFGFQGQPHSMLLWMSNDIDVPPQAKTPMLIQPGLPGLPLRIERIDERGQKVTDLNTVSFQRRQLTAADFTFPATYKRLASDVDVIVPERAPHPAAARATTGKRP